jgi:hypothetical protein
MKRLTAVVLCGFAVLALAPSASAAIRIKKIYYDSPGADTGSNSSLNAEWITIRNTGSKGRNITGWRIRDAAGHVYCCFGMVLPAETTVKLHTGSGADSYPHHLYWELDNYVWNNVKDKAILKNAAGTVIDTCSYNNASANYKLC